MKREKITIGSFAHVYNRGNRKQSIVRDQKDKWHFLEILYYFNDEFMAINPFRNLHRLRLDLNTSFNRPLDWPERKPLVKIIAFSLLENHFHLLLEEIKEGGVTKFMRRLGTGMASYFNAKYQEVGSLFQVSYRVKIIDEEIYFKYLSVYIQVKNVFEMYPGGLKGAIEDFDKAYEWAIQYSYCSLADYAGKRNSPLIDKDVLGELFSRPEEYKEFAKQCLIGMNLDDKLGKLTLEN